MKLTYHGHSFFSLTDATYHVVIDPFISGNPLCEVKADEIKPTHILITHGHRDHLGNALELAKRNKSLIIGTAEIARYCGNKGAATHSMHIGGSHAFQFGRVKLTPAWHGSSVNEGEDIIYAGSPCGFIVEMQGRTIYHAGDTGLFGDMKLIGDRRPLDCALLPIGDNFVMGPEDALLAAQMLNARLTVPMHYDTFPIIKQDPQAFVRNLQSQGLAGQVMKPGETLEF